MDYKNLKIGDFKAQDIGILHNKILQTLNDAGRIHAKKDDMILFLTKTNIDKRISSKTLKMRLLVFIKVN